ncbi:flavodoxin family protein [Desulfobacter vibrioformis]|uniref:flavodoxin family protein n=1 Tax=Desulfobacter vibrioformis TaxID=34031 RepID=UPI000691022E|nr:flavodoxin family protein [Desulfobacter vibrioformis]
MPFKIVGVSASPIKNGNTDTFLSTIMDQAKEKGLETETINLSEFKIENCIHCNFCLNKQKADRYCALRDDVQIIYEKLESANIIVFASPVYFMRTSGMMATFIDRLRVFIFGNVAGGKLKNKIGISAGVSWLRHGGMETTHLSHICAFITLDMIPATSHASISPLGASGVSSRYGEGVFDSNVRLGVCDDEAGINAAKAHLARALELSNLINKETTLSNRED